MAENCRNFARKRSDVSRIIKKRSTIAAFNFYFFTDSKYNCGFKFEVQRLT